MSGCAARSASQQRPSRRAGGMVLVLILSFLCLLPQAYAAKTAKATTPSNADCLACHSPDAGLTKDVNGKPVSLAVD